jgi:hypothetical protein
MKILADWRFIIGALIAIALAATLIATTLERIFDHREFFAALGETVAIIAAATFAWWILRG